MTSAFSFLKVKTDSKQCLIPSIASRKRYDGVMDGELHGWNTFTFAMLLSPSLLILGELLMTSTDQLAKLGEMVSNSKHFHVINCNYCLNVVIHSI